eukprot:symbB.v1.2.012330.t1/scaffold840.1/size211989/1
MLFLVKRTDGILVKCCRPLEVITLASLETDPIVAITAGDLDGVTIDQMDGMLRCLRVWTSAKKAGKARFVNHITGTWDEITGMGMRHDGVPDLYPMGAPKVFLPQTDNGIVPVPCHSGQVFTLSFIRGLTPCPLTSEMLRCLTVDELKHFDNNIAPRPQKMGVKDKDGVIVRVIDGFEQMDGAVAIPLVNVPESETEEETNEESDVDNDQKVMTIQDFLDIEDPENACPDEDDTALFFPSFLRVFEDEASLSVKVLVQGTLLFAVPMSPIATVEDTKTRIAQTINSLQGHLKMPVASDDFVLKVSGLAMSDDAELTTFAMEGNTELRIAMEFRTRGGGKTLATKKSGITKQAILLEKQKAVLAKMKEVNIAKMVVEKQIIESAGNVLSQLYVQAERDGEASFQYLLQKISARNLGDKDASAVMDATRASHSDVRIANLANLMLRDTFPSLYGLYDEVNTMVESAELSYEYILTCAFAKEDMTVNWTKLRKAIEIERARRAPPAVIANVATADGGNDMDL